jgi:hypothetical protein
MWEGLKGSRRKNGVMGTAISVVVAAILLYLSFYIAFLYLIIPIVILIIFHYTKLWRFTDRSFYGFIAIVLAFIIAMGGISSNIESSPHQSTSVQTISNTTYDIHFSYSQVAGYYSVSLTMPSVNVSPAAKISLLDLFTNQTLVTYPASLVREGNNFTVSQNISRLSERAYVVLFNFSTFKNNSTSSAIVPHSVEFLGPVLLPLTTVTLLFSERLFVSYFIITFLFYLAFAFFARAITVSRQRRSKREEEIKGQEIKEEKKEDKQN